jgi:hypothetical protein
MCQEERQLFERVIKDIYAVDPEMAEALAGDAVMAGNVVEAMKEMHDEFTLPQGR